jgi:hypothetical protein
VNIDRFYKHPFFQLSETPFQYKNVKDPQVWKNKEYFKNDQAENTFEINYFERWIWVENGRLFIVYIYICIDIVH